MCVCVCVCVCVCGLLAGYMKGEDVGDCGGWGGMHLACGRCDLSLWVIDEGHWYPRNEPSEDCYIHSSRN